MARVSINILGTSELSGLEWVNLIQMTIYIYYCGQESLRRNGVAIIVNKRVQNAVLRCNLKNYTIICLFPRQTIQYQTNPSLCPDQ